LTERKARLEILKARGKRESFKLGLGCSPVLLQSLFHVEFRDPEPIISLQLRHLNPDIEQAKEHLVGFDLIILRLLRIAWRTNLLYSYGEAIKVSVWLKQWTTTENTTSELTPYTYAP
jgi:hypothetical protein